MGNGPLAIGTDLMQVQVFPSLRSGVIVTSLYVVLIFASLSRTPSIVLWLAGKGFLLYSILFAFISVTVVILTAAMGAGRLWSYPFWLTLLCAVIVYIGVSHYTIALSERIHLLVYGLLCFFIFCVIRFRLQGGALFLASGVLTSLVGVADEVTQHFLPNRFFAWGDIAINILGGLCGLMVIRFALGDRGRQCTA